MKRIESHSKSIKVALFWLGLWQQDIMADVGLGAFPKFTVVGAYVLAPQPKTAYGGEIPRIELENKGKENKNTKEISYAKIRKTSSTSIQLPYPFNGKDLVYSKENKSYENRKRRNKDTTKIGTLTVPSVGIGTISWSSNKLTTLENPEVEDLVKEACDLDVAFFDTAERYGSHLKTALGMGWGETELLTQQSLQRFDEEYMVRKGKMPNHNAVVATKFTPTPWRTTAESVVKACQESCERLGVSKIPLYQLHMPDIVQPAAKLLWNDEAVRSKLSKDEIYWEGLAECYNRGLVENVGVCNYGPTLVAKCQEALGKRGVPLASNQIAYSLIGRHNGAQETVDKCNELGIKTIAYFPFAMGLLTGKYSSNEANLVTSNAAETALASGSSANSLITSQKTKLELRDLNTYLTGNGKDIPKGGMIPLLKVMETIAKRRQKTVAQVALNYIICKGAVPIPGARTVEQMRDNSGALGWRLSSSEVAMLEYEADRLGFGFEGAGFKRTSEKFVGYGVEKWSLN